ncbi:hypothetical protein WJX72_010493 [[Myrmecia] bisecta]|uniref:Phosphate transporter n=1 Tax=[Myrmecia] bisecta TaxID=41462 RepID=A0AAW1Q4P7_9CHLO
MEDGTAADQAKESVIRLVVVGALGAFGFGWGTGSNDVANAFATSVGAKTLTLRQAVVIAAIFEFAGALLLGRVSTATIAGGIADYNSFTRYPEVFAYGMVCALLVGTFWLAYASWAGLNVSSTHSIIGAIIGFALVWDGGDAVIWARRAPVKGTFPPYKGVVSIVMAWFIAPILTGGAAALFFWITRFAVLRRRNAYNLSFWLLPPFVLITTWINLYFVFTKGAKKTLSKNSDWTDQKAAWISAAAAAGVALLSLPLSLYLLKPYINRQFDENGNKIVKNIKALGIPVADDVEGAKLADDSPNSIDAQKAANAAAATPMEPVKPSFRSYMRRARTAVRGAALHGTSVNIHDVVSTDAEIGAIHANAEVFEARVEYSFSFLQVFSACCVIFAHGAGEVGYMAGPLAVIWDVYKTGSLPKDVSPPVWVILIGAFGLVIGLATYGYNVTRSMGVKLAKITPTRGFAAELATAFVIMIAAQYGLPTSSSQCITGAIVGVGLCEGAKTGVNWRQFAKQFCSWVATLFVVGLLTAALFAQGVYAPGKVDGHQVMVYEDRVTNLTTNVYKDFNTTLYQYKGAASNGSLTRLNASQWSSLDKSIKAANTYAKGLIDYNAKKNANQTAFAEDVTGALYKALALVQQNTVNTLGQNDVYAGATLCNSNVTSSNGTVACPAPKLLPTAYATKFP